jgi:uncharacterized membrane protein
MEEIKMGMGRSLWLFARALAQTQALPREYTFWKVVILRGIFIFTAFILPLLGVGAGVFGAFLVGFEGTHWLVFILMGFISGLAISVAVLGIFAPLVQKRWILDVAQRLNIDINEYLYCSEFYNAVAQA